MFYSHALRVGLLIFRRSFTYKGGQRILGRFLAGVSVSPNIDSIPFFTRPIGQPRIRIIFFHPGSGFPLYLLTERSLSPFLRMREKRKREGSATRIPFLLLPFSFYLPRRAIHRSIGVLLPWGTKTRANNIANSQYFSSLSQEKIMGGGKGDLWGKFVSKSTGGNPKQFRWRIRKSTVSCADASSPLTRFSRGWWMDKTRSASLNGILMRDFRCVKKIRSK